MKIAFLTSGGNAPCLFASIGRLLHNYSNLDSIELIGYRNGFSGLLKGESEIFLLSNFSNSNFEAYYDFGGSPIGNSRVKLTNRQDCIDRKLIQEGEDPLEIAANQLMNDKVDILHTIGGDDTNTTAKDLCSFIKSNGLDITIVGIPKTIDNDIFPVKRSLGAYTAAEAGARYFSNIVNENNMSSSHLIIHEIMGRNSGWLAAKTADYYCNIAEEKKQKIKIADSLAFYNPKRFDIHGLYIPETLVSFDDEIDRLQRIIKDIGCINIFVSEGAFIKEISRQVESDGSLIDKDAFGHIKLDSINTGKWLSDIISKDIEIDRVLIQKSGYFSRSSAPNKSDLDYIFKVCDFAFDNALKSNSGVVGEDERTGELSCIDFNEIRGDKGLDINSKWFLDLVSRIEN